MTAGNYARRVRALIRRSRREFDSNAVDKDRRGKKGRERERENERANKKKRKRREKETIPERRRRFSALFGVGIDQSRAG